MKIVDMRKKTMQELKEELILAYKESLNLRFQKASGELKNTARISYVRKKIARLNTVINEVQNA